MAPAFMKRLSYIGRKETKKIHEIIAHDGKLCEGKNMKAEEKNYRESGFRKGIKEIPPEVVTCSPRSNRRERASSGKKLQ